MQRAKEIARNKKERKFQRDASKLKSNPDALKEELKEVQCPWHACLTLAKNNYGIHSS